MRVSSDSKITAAVLQVFILSRSLIQIQPSPVTRVTGKNVKPLMCWNFTILYVATCRFFRSSFSIWCCDKAVIMPRLGLDTKTTWLGLGNLFCANMAGIGQTFRYRFVGTGWAALSTVTPSPPSPLPGITVRSWASNLNIIWHILFKCLYGTWPVTRQNVNVSAVCRNMDAILMWLGPGGTNTR